VHYILQLGEMHWLWELTILTLSKDGSTSTFLLNIEAKDSIAFIWIAALSPKEYGRYFAELSISKNQAVDNEQVYNFHFLRMYYQFDIIL